MSTSTDGIIFFGILCPEECELPWHDAIYDNDIEEWWRKENGFEDILNPWTAEGDYAEGWSTNDPRFDAYYQHRRDWIKSNPLPVDLIHHCSDSYPMFAIAVPNTELTASRGCPERFDPAQLSVGTDQIEKLKAFLTKYEIPYDGEPGWILTSYWG